MTAGNSVESGMTGTTARLIAMGGLLAAIWCLAETAAGPVYAQSRPAAVAGSGLPLPRFVSLKSDRVNLRTGPGTDYPTAWVYRRAGLPVEVIKEFESWRKVRDAEGATGWILNSLLSGRRTALVLPWEVKNGEPRPAVDVRISDSDRSRPVAKVEAGVIANLHACDGSWCRITIDKYRGYLQQSKLWGIYQNETLE